MEWHNNLEAELQGVAARSRRRPAVATAFQPSKVEPVNGNIVNLGLIVLILVLVTALVVAWYFKTQVTSNSQIANNSTYQQPYNGHRHDRYYPEYENVQSDPVDDKRAEVTRQLWERSKTTNDRLALKAMVDNHNTAVLKYGYPKSDLLYINGDWTIDHMPKHLQLDADDSAFLRQFLK